MIFWILFISFLSLIFIYLVHQVFLFFKSTLTTPKIKDFIYYPSKKYDEINEIISYNKINKVNNNTTLIDNLKSQPPQQIDTMKEDLKSFLKKQLQTI